DLVQRVEQLSARLGGTIPRQSGPPRAPVSGARTLAENGAALRATVGTEGQPSGERTSTPTSVPTPTSSSNGGAHPVASAPEAPQASLHDEKERARKEQKVQRLQAGRDHPAVRAAVELLGGEIEDVRDLGEE